MLARLILALLLAAFALPAAALAACHDMRETMAMDMRHAMPATDHHDENATPHGCIGCVPPSNWTAARDLGVMPVRCPRRVAAARILAIGAAPTPDTPPPRNA